ncbi:MAG: zinc-binding dehydrogenase [Bacteroidales bacterium]
MDLGADLVVSPRDLEDALACAGVKEVDCILNFVDTDAYWDVMARLIRPLGSICSIVRPQQPKDLGLFFQKAVSFSWELMFTKSSFQTPDMESQHHILSRVAQLVDEGRVKSPVTTVLRGFSVENLKKAHLQLESHQTIGKVVVAF